MSSKSISQSKMDRKKQMKVAQQTKTKSFNFYSNLYKELKESLSFFIQESNYMISKKMIKNNLKTNYKKVIQKIQEVTKRMQVCCPKDKNLKIINEIKNLKSKNLIKIKLIEAYFIFNI